MKKQITRISILQSSKIVTALYVLIGFIYIIPGVLMLIFGSGQFQLMGAIYCAMPVIMAVLGFVFFTIFAALYNLLAKWLGGIEFEVTEVQ